MVALDGSTIILQRRDRMGCSYRLELHARVCMYMCMCVSRERTLYQHKVCSEKVLDSPNEIHKYCLLAEFKVPVQMKYISSTKCRHYIKYSLHLLRMQNEGTYLVH